MKYYWAIVILAIIAVGASEDELTTSRIGQREAGDQYLGFTSNSSVYTTEPEAQEVTLFLNAPPGSLITLVHMNIFQRWTIYSYYYPLVYNGDIEINSSNTTNLRAHAFYYGFPPGSPEAIAAQANGKLSKIEDRKVVTNPDE